MKRVIVIGLLLLSAMMFAQEWYSSKQKVDDLNPRISQKDSVWYGYGETSNWVISTKAERATYYNVNDFGLEYPINLHGVTSYLYDSLYTYSYKIYDKDGITLLYQSNTGTSFKGYNEVNFATPMIMQDDFWFSIVPQADGLPRNVSTDVVDSEHSFVGQPGAWEPINSVDERYEWMNYIALSPYTGTDTYSPSIRSFVGGENFMLTDANIFVTIQDQSILTSVYGEYDIGAGWVTFDVAVSKTTSVYSGTIPGQADGVSAKVRFYAEDEYGNNITSDEYSVDWTKNIPILKEGFEDITFPPIGWSTQTLENTVGFVRTALVAGGVQHEGKYSAAHMDETYQCDSWLITPKISIPNTGFSSIFVWQYAWYLQYVTSGTHEICVSTDMANWDVLYSGHPPVGTTGSGGVWEKKIISLVDYLGQDIYIGFRFNANYENQWYIDDLTVVYDDLGPVITEIKANEALLPVIGAYLNNPINVSIKTSDASGTKSVAADYDIGGQTGNIILSESKAEEGSWYGTIPAQASEATGTLKFTLVDIGDIVAVTDDYEIKFVEDNAAPIISEFSYGKPILINQNMTISLNLKDESEISSAICYYSKDNWVSETPFSMTLSKMHEYIYQCVIPAETEETFAEVRFELSDAPGNIKNSGMYEVKWLLGLEVVYDDFESGQSAFWDWTTPSTLWGITASESVSPSNSLADSPAGNYPDLTKNRIMSNPMDFTGFLAVSAYYWAKIDVEPEWEFCKLQVTTSTAALPPDAEWVTLAQYDGYDNPWQYYEVNMGSLAALNNVRLRLSMDSDPAVNGDGAYIDNFRIVGFYEDYAPPLIIYVGPDIITSEELTIPREFTIPVGMGDYKFEVELIDISDISEVKVVYSADGGPEQDALPLISSGPSGIYEMVIPAQPAGTKVRYKVVATDNSKYFNSAETIYYNIHFGNYLYYQNGDDYTDYYDVIGSDNSASCQAVANRVTMGPMDEKGQYRSNLVGITIDNYSDIESGYPSDPMYIHVWEDAYGVPGKDLIEPYYFEQPSKPGNEYEITYVDLRPYADILSGIEGDVFVGFTSAGTATLMLYEVSASHTGVPGYVDFQRSWMASLIEDELVWTFAPERINHISAVIGDYEYVDAPLPPRGFTVKNVSGSNILNWLADPNPSIDHYNIYRGDNEGFEIVTPIGSVLAVNPTTYTDMTPPAGSLYYKITAVDGGGIESSPTLGLEPTGIEEESLPLTTQLYQNYPNPFNPETTIKFSIAENAKVNLSVYNSKGEMVENLVNENLNRGSYDVSFNGSRLTSGVYYTVMKANEKIMTNKMIMLK